MPHEIRCAREARRARQSARLRQEADGLRAGQERTDLECHRLGRRRPRLKTKPNAKLLALAVEGGKKADELAKEKDAAIADTLAMAYFDSGEVTKAVETQERAVKLAKGTPLEQNKEMEERLEKYKKAAAKDKA